MMGLRKIIIMPKQGNIQIEKLIVKLKNLPQIFEGVKIVHLSDLHSSKFDVREKEILKIIDELNPNFIFITGDFLSSRSNIKLISPFWQILGKKYTNRIFGVWGNHDHWSRNFETLKKSLKQSQIEILENEKRELKINPKGKYIYLIGVDDPSYTERDDLLKAMDKIIDTNTPKILLAHSPDIISKAKKQNIDLVLSGHIHGGQIILPWIGPLFVPSRYGRKYLQGLFKENSTYLYVNRGIGSSFLPIRNVPLEVTLIELQKQ